MGNEIRAKLRRLVVDEELRETYIVLLAFLTIGLITPHIVGYKRAGMIIGVLAGLILFGFHLTWFTRDAREDGKANPRKTGVKQLVTEIVFGVAVVVGVFAVGFGLKYIADIPVFTTVLAVTVLITIGFFVWFFVLLFRYLFTDSVQLTE